MLTPQQQFFKSLEKSESPLITFSADWRGDAVATSLALFLLLKKMGKKPELIAAPSIKKDIWSFLPSSNEIKNSLDNLRQFIISLQTNGAKINKIKYLNDNSQINFIISSDDGQFKNEGLSLSEDAFRYDLIIIIGAIDFESLGQIYDNNIEFFYKTTIVNIDHQAENEGYGQINLTDITSTSTAEIIFNLFKDKYFELFDEDITTCLLTGIISETKNFRHTNLKPQTLMTTSSLIALGGRREEIINSLYNSREIKTLKLWGKVLGNLRGSMVNSLIWSYLKKDDLGDNLNPENYLIDIIEELIANIPEAQVIAIIFESHQEENNRLLIYSTKNINALEFIKDYNPIGSKKIAIAELRGETEKIVPNIISELEKKLKGLF